MNTERTEKFVNAIACDLEEGGFRQVSGTMLRRTLATAVSAALPLLAAQQGVDGWDIAEKVRADLDRQSCPDAYMRIAVESVVKHLGTYRAAEEPVCYISPGDAEHIRLQAVTLRHVATYWKKPGDDAVPVHLGQPALAATGKQQGGALRYLTQSELDSIGSQAEGMDGEQWDRWVQARFAEVNGFTTVDSDGFTAITTTGNQQVGEVQGATVEICGRTYLLDDVAAALNARKTDEPVADWSKRGSQPTDWRNELLTLADHHEPIPTFARSAMRVIARSMPEPGAARQPGAEVPEWFELVIRDVCELEPEDPDAADTVCIRALDLRLIMERHAATPAQGIDLGQFIALAKFGEEFAFSAEKQPHSRVVYSQASRLLALIDRRGGEG